jgi:uncharacterized membrane protein YhhN
MTPVPALLVAAFVAGALTILADFKGRFGLVYVFKPLTMASVIAIAALGRARTGGPYGALILTGLLVSLAGDIFLMLRKKRFIQGLACFLLAQVLYGAAFLSGVPFGPPAWTGVLFAAFAVFVFRALSPRLGPMKAPVAVYVIVITAMAALAANRYAQLGGAAALSALAGAGLFLVSDTSLAVNRFVGKRRFGQLLTLGTYFAAQALFALSI